jgi:outer membrane protein assembly factor BamB
MITNRRQFLTLATCFSAFLQTPSADATENWPDFRGPDGSGISAIEPGALPTEWAEDKNIVWKTAVEGRAWSSPVVWGDQIWITTASEDGVAMGALCLDRESGKVVHQLPLFKNDIVEPLGNSVNAYGSPSPVIEEGRVYVHFGSYGTAAIDTATGKMLWQRTDLPCKHFRGPGSSPLLINNLLILSMDGIDVQYMVALDTKTGKNVWRTDRSTEWDDIDPNGVIRGRGDLRKAYSTPTLIELGGESVLISPAAKACYAYTTSTGKELWHITYKGYSNASRTVLADGHAFINTGYGKPHLVSLRLDPKARGDITDSHIDWDIFKRVPKRSSPIIVDRRLYMVSDEGILSCLDIASGDEIWSNRLRGHFSASPVYAGGLLYFFSEMGDAYIVRPGEKFEQIAANKLEGGFMASPALTGKSIIARSKTHVYRIENR